MVNLSRAMNRAELAVMRFDFTGLGESEGDFADTSFVSNVDDLVAAARYLEAEHSAPKILVGHSLGGAAVIQAAAEVPSAVAVATIGAPADPAHVTRLLDRFDRRDPAGRARPKSCWPDGNSELERSFSMISKRRSQNERIRSLDRALIIFHSPVDRIVGIDNAARIYSTARHPKSFISLDRADHLLTDPSDASYVGEVLAAWARKYLPECRDEQIPDMNGPRDVNVDASRMRPKFILELPLPADEAILRIREGLDTPELRDSTMAAGRLRRVPRRRAREKNVVPAPDRPDRRRA